MVEYAVLRYPEAWLNRNIEYKEGEIYKIIYDNHKYSFDVIPDPPITNITQAYTQALGIVNRKILIDVIKEKNDKKYVQDILDKYNNKDTIWWHIKN